jgi:hypothetical protein
MVKPAVGSGLVGINNKPLHAAAYRAQRLEPDAVAADLERLPMMPGSRKAMGAFSLTLVSMPPRPRLIVSCDGPASRWKELLSPFKVEMRAFELPSRSKYLVCLTSRPTNRCSQMPSVRWAPPFIEGVASLPQDRE